MHMPLLLLLLLLQSATRAASWQVQQRLQAGRQATHMAATLCQLQMPCWLCQHGYTVDPPLHALTAEQPGRWSEPWRP